MFKRLPDRTSDVVRFSFDGIEISAQRGDTIAAALLAAGRLTLRQTPVSGTPRGPYCLMGICFECLVTIDGAANRQACMVIVEDGMTVQTQRGPAAPLQAAT
jgi:predicted molibdopterin-dependent oxidoreductase YjgC